MDYKKFLLFGDSITEFAFNPEHFAVGSALSNVYSRKLDILQRGYAGFNTRWAIPVLKNIIDQDGEDIVMGTIFFGSNDSVATGPQRVPLPEFVENTKKLIQIMKDANIKPIVVGPGLLNRDIWEVIKKDDIEKGWIRSNEAFKEYNHALKKLTYEVKVPYINLQECFLKVSRANNEEWQSYTIDGLHFSGAGYKIYFDQLMKVIDTFYPEYSPSTLKTNLPNWRDIQEDGSNIF
ncbi:isoamyl acetate-hydrolyzing esterase [Monosporozyma unispora]|nr:hypothetical protein C6P44_002413 [Kazachstania unispora]